MKKKKNTHNLKAEIYNLFRGLSENLCLEADSQTALRDGSKELWEELGYIIVLQQRPDSWNIKRLSPLFKENPDISS